MTVTSLKLTEALDEQLTEQAHRRRLTMSELVRRAPRRFSNPLNKARMVHLRIPLLISWPIWWAVVKVHHDPWFVGSALNMFTDSSLFATTNI
jgi:hypothetical protein